MDERVEAKCCKVGCGVRAEFLVEDEGGGVEDYTHACRQHVGDLVTNVPARVSMLGAP